MGRSSKSKKLMAGVLDHLQRPSTWYYLTPVAVACAPVLKTYFNQNLRRPMRQLLPFLDPFVTIDILAKPEQNSNPYMVASVKSSDAYAEVLAYLSAVCSLEARELRAEGAAEGHGLVLSLREGQEVADEFKGVTMWWSAVAEGVTVQGSPGRCCRLTFHERHRRLVVEEYLPYVRRTGQEVTFGNRPRRLYSNNKDVSYISSREEVWRYIDFHHPTTFDTLAMDPAKKKKIMDDLDNFRNNKDYYRRIGKAWKRGYLLYGPPGTGKSTMIAAMANYLNYDIYDIELTTLQTNSDLRKLFIETTGKSIIVIEDIDCSLDLTGSRLATKLPRAGSRQRRRPTKLPQCQCQHTDAVRPAQLYRWAVVGTQRRADHCVHDQLHRRPRPGADPARTDGHAHRDVLLRVWCVQDPGQELPWSGRSPAVRHHRGAAEGGGDYAGGCCRVSYGIEPHRS